MQLSEQLDIDIGGYMYKLLIYIYIYVCLNINLSPLSYITISLDSEIVKCVVCIKLPIYGYMCLNMKLHCLNRHNFIFISSVNSIKTFYRIDFKHIDWPVFAIRIQAGRL